MAQQEGEKQEGIEDFSLRGEMDEFLIEGEMVNWKEIEVDAILGEERLVEENRRGR